MRSLTRQTKVRNSIGYGDNLHFRRSESDGGQTKRPKIVLLT